MDADIKALVERLSANKMEPNDMTTKLVWHFAGPTLRDGSPHPAPGFCGQHIADPVPCEKGYHGSEDILDALTYAPGPYLCRRMLSGTIISHGSPVDKLVASDFQQATSYVDATNVLQQFARHCAWQARQYAANALDRADLADHAATLRAFPEECDLADARDAAWAAGNAAQAAGNTAWDAAQAAARDAAQAVGDAAQAAGAAAWATRDAERDAAWAAAWDAARADQRKYLLAHVVP